MRVFTRLILAVSAICLSVLTVQAGEPEKAKLKIAVGSQILNYMPLELGVKLGMFRDEGLDVTVENFQAGGSKALQALIGGSVDGTVGFYDHTIQMQAQGKEISCVFLLNDIPGVLLGVRNDLADKVRTGADLKGLKLGITAPGSSTDTMARYYIKKAGLGPRDVNIIAVGSGAPGMVALEAKNIDALVYFDPVATLLARKSSATPLFDARTIDGSKQAFGGIYPTACLYLQQSFIDKNPETVQRLVNAFLKTHRWINSAPTEQLVDAMPAGYKTDNRDVNIEIMKASKALFSQTGQMDVEAAKVPLAVLSDYDPKIAAAKIDLTKTFTNRFADRAAQQLK
ncbi:ABC transporter substrate-binding protein [Bradyrhizobium diazoefficiens]|uniref:ABC transporter substrate-binding protein n=1 Tax=Bradyrhizobium diazoefficiens TaxID=1355477 RepID=UPI00190A94A2|nr:ABC transporter substrate-binding protein [Bradyrhizobium diazoefficiens]QQO12066.1 ABC transporter substrate-binding protein [Bradyrhizobium diazoefficiens]